jgi:hypothetical protein
MIKVRPNIIQLLREGTLSRMKPNDLFNSYSPVILTQMKVVNPMWTPLGLLENANRIIALLDVDMQILLEETHVS